jgi:hypothetical protein
VFAVQGGNSSRGCEVIRRGRVGPYSAVRRKRSEAGRVTRCGACSSADPAPGGHRVRPSGQNGSSGCPVLCPSQRTLPAAIDRQHLSEMLAWGRRRPRQRLKTAVRGLTITHAPYGEGGIRTRGRVAPTPVFETGSFNHSDTSPRPRRRVRPARRRSGRRFHLTASPRAGQGAGTYLPGRREGEKGASFRRRCKGRPGSPSGATVPSRGSGRTWRMENPTDEDPELQVRQERQGPGGRRARPRPRRPSSRTCTPDSGGSTWPWGTRTRTR